MRLDAHQHFWVYTDNEYPWIKDNNRILKQDYLPPHVHPSLIDNGFHGAIAVQARQNPAETAYLVSLARQYSFIKGVVGWTDLRAPNLLAALSATRGQVVGFRHQLEDEADNEFMLRADFMRGIRMLGDFNYTYDLLVHPRHLQATIKLVDAFPTQPFVIDHMAKPDYNADAGTWITDMQTLAERENVYCKLSGMCTDVDSNQFTGNGYDEDAILVDVFVPFVDCLLEAFGPDRLMFGSDWPVCTRSATFDEVVDIATLLTEGLSRSEQAAIFGGTAAKFYGIK